jgi:hypothetical protein
MNAVSAIFSASSDKNISSGEYIARLHTACHGPRRRAIQ